MELEINKLHQGIPNEEYHREEGLNASKLRRMMRSPLHYFANKDEQATGDHLRFGANFHALIESPENFRERYRIAPEVNMRTNAGKAEMQAFIESLGPNDMMIKADEVEDLTGMANSIRSHSRVRNILKNGIAETSLWVTDPDTGLILKCRPDFITERGHLIDIKTTRNAHEDFFMGQIFSNRTQSPFYVLQAAHYVHCLKLAGVCKSESMTIIAVEKSKPWGIKVYPLDIGCLGVGEQWRDKLTKQYAECLESGVWPGYPEKIIPVVPPNWVQAVDPEEDDE